MAPKASKAPKAPNPQPELPSYRTLIRATYSSVTIEEIPIVPPGKAQWRIRFDGGAPINGHLIDVVLNDAAMKAAKRAAKKARQRTYAAIRENEELALEEADAEIKKMEETFITRFTPGERDEAYRNSINIGNRPLHEDFAALPVWVQQEIVQRPSSSEDDMHDETGPLPGNENTEQASADGTSPTEIETGDGQPGPLPEDNIETVADVDGTTPAVIEAAVGQPGLLPGSEVETEADVEDTSATVIEPDAVQSGLLRGDEIETEPNVDDTSVTAIEHHAGQSGLLVGDEIDIEPNVRGTSSTEVDSHADGQSELPSGEEIETELSAGDLRVTTDVELVGGQSGLLSANETETELRVDDPDSREIEPEADRAGLQPLHVTNSVSTAKHPVTAVTEQPVTGTDPQSLMPQAFAKQANLTQQADEHQRHQHHRQPSVQQQHQLDQQPSAQQPSTEQPSAQQPPSAHQSSSTPTTTANIPATATGLSIKEQYLLIYYGLDGPTSVEALKDKMAHPTIMKVDAIQEMLVEFCTKVMWHRYCITPASDTTPEFKALTSNSVDDRGVRGPTHPIPASFLERLMHELNRLLEECREDRRMLILRSIQWPGNLGQNVHTLLSEEVLWMRGPEGEWTKQDSLDKIGLLLECVGIMNKGSMWKG